MPSVRIQGRILVVEDDESVAQATRAVLTSWGASVTIAASAEAALAFLERDPFDAVLSDYRLPGQSGADVLVFAQARAPLTLRVLISGEISEDLSEFARAGRFLLLRKPVSAQRLRSVLRPLATSA